MLFLSGCRSKFSPRHHAVHVWHTAGLGGCHGVSHIYREGLERMFKSNSHLLGTGRHFVKLHWVIQNDESKKMQDVSSNRRWLCFFDDDFIPPIAGSSILVCSSVLLEGWFGSGWNCYESLRRPLALCLLRLLQTMAAVGAPNQMVDEESLSWVVFNPIFLELWITMCLLDFKAHGFW